jgi:hypothetical protein
MTDRIAIVGAGLIGRAWAAVFARAGLAVTLTDRDPEALGARLGRHLPDPSRGLRCAAGPDRADSRRAHLLPRACARPDRGTLRDRRRPDLLTEADPMSRKTIVAGVTPAILGEAARASLALDPRRLARNPVIFVTFVVAGHAPLPARPRHRRAGGGGGRADHALALGHGALRELRRGRRRGPRQGAAASLRATKTEAETCRLAGPSRSNQAERVASSKLRRGDVIHVEAGELIPADGEIVEGVASVNENAITGESAPVIRESGGDRSAVAGGTLVVSDWLVIRVTADPGRSFLDRMIAMVEGARGRRRRTRSRSTSCSAASRSSSSSSS